VAPKPLRTASPSAGPCHSATATARLSLCIAEGRSAQERITLHPLCPTCLPETSGQGSVPPDSGLRVVTGKAIALRDLANHSIRSESLAGPRVRVLFLNRSNPRAVLTSVIRDARCTNASCTGSGYRSSTAPAVAPVGGTGPRTLGPARDSDRIGVVSQILAGRSLFRTRGGRNRGGHCLPLVFRRHVGTKWWVLCASGADRPSAIHKLIVRSGSGVARTRRGARRPQGL